MGEITVVTRRNSIELTRPQYVLELRPRATINTGGTLGPSVVTNTFTQLSPLAVWTVNHNLNRKPVVTLKTLGTTVIEGQIDHISDDQFTVSFNTPQAGQALFI